MKTKRTVEFLLAVAVVVLLSSSGDSQDTGMPTDRVALRYRIEFMDDGDWEPVKENKKFRRNQTIRFRFMGNTSGTLHVLNGSEEDESLHPVFAAQGGRDLRRHFGLGTHVDANQVGIFPAPAQGGGMRFTGVKGVERFLFMFVPDELQESRAMMAIVPGAENWNFEAQSTYMVTGDPGEVLFHYFELRSR